MDTLRQQLQAEIAKGIEAIRLNPDHYRGDNWWKLSDAEEEIFQIGRNSWPRLSLTWQCYEAFKGLSGSPTWDDALLDQARQACPRWYSGPPSLETFQVFAKTYGGLSFREAHAVYAKQQFWECRLGVAVYGDEQGEDEA